MTSAYDSERLAAAYAFGRLSVHGEFVRSAAPSQQADWAWT